MNKRPESEQASPSAALFPTTRWTVVLGAGDGAAESSDLALEELCRTYWSPLYAYLRRQGHSPHDAQDLTQGFLARVIAREDLGNVGPEKGRFRTYLLAGLRNFTIKRALHEKALKRGGNRVRLSINEQDAERICGPDLSVESPELAFDRRWCRTILGRVIQQLRDEQQARSKLEQFEILSTFLDGADPGDYEVVAKQLGMPSGTVAVTLHRLRARLRELMKAEVAQTVAEPDQVDAEMRYLMEVWQR